MHGTRGACDRRHRAVRGLHALPVSRQRSEEPGALAVRRAGAARVRRRATRPSASFLQADCLLEGAMSSSSVQVRFLHVQRRTVERLDGDGFRDVDSLDVGDATYLPWDEAVVTNPRRRSGSPTSTRPKQTTAIARRCRGRDRGAVRRRRSDRRPAGPCAHAPLPDALSCDGRAAARSLRRPAAAAAAGEHHAMEPSTGSGAPDRPDALRHALVAAHLLLSAARRRVHVADRPAGMGIRLRRRPASRSAPSRCWPGRPVTRRSVLASPIILYDHPRSRRKARRSSATRPRWTRC